MSGTNLRHRHSGIVHAVRTDDRDRTRCGRLLRAGPARTDAPVTCRPCRRGCRPRGAYARAELAPMERRVLALLAADLTNKEIARRLSISDQTVKNHLTSIYARLGVASRVGAALVYWRAHERGVPR